MILLSIWVVRDQSAQFPHSTYPMLFVYGLFAVGFAALTWRDWWLDARLAAPAHLIDMGIFTAIAFSIGGATNPFFLFFILPLLSAAIRWSWRETLLTAIVLILIHLAAGISCSPISRSSRSSALSSEAVTFSSLGSSHLVRPTSAIHAPVVRG